MVQPYKAYHDDKKYVIHPYKFILWVAMASIVMMFAAFTSAYIVRRAGGDWLQFALPDIFWFTTATIVISSITMHMAYIATKKDVLKRIRWGLGITLFLGIAFLIGQWNGWQLMTASGVTLDGNPAGSFIYVISGVHALHIIGGLVFLLVLFLKSLQGKMGVKNKLSMELCATYWHFVDLLWVYLFFFFLFNR